MVNTAYAQGGAGRVAQILHTVVNGSPGHRSLFAYGRGPANQRALTLRFALQLEVFFHAFLTRLTGIQGYGTFLTTRRLLRLIRWWKPDVIHFHNIHGYYLDLSIAPSVDKLKIPVVWTLHDAWPLTGRCAYFFQCDGWRTGCTRCFYRRTYPKSYFDSCALMCREKRRLLGDVWRPVIVTPSQWLAAFVAEACEGKCRVEVIPNGVDTQLFRPRQRLEVRRKMGLPQDKKIILFTAANLRDERKGARYFFESLRFIAVQNWMAVTVGEKVDLPADRADEQQIKQLGPVRDSELMASIYSAADVFCISSLDDNFPSTVLESLSSGTPVVGFRVGGIQEQVTEDCGILVARGNSRALGNAITMLLENDELREKMSTNSRVRVISQYSIGQFGSRYIELYRELLRDVQKTVTPA